MASNFPFKSYCWSIGTTSFRTKNFNRTIEEQLGLIRQFWEIHANVSEIWTGNNKLQAKYYDFMVSVGFVDGEAKNKPKDAREKTSGLVDIGLLNSERKLTEVGIALLELCDNGDFKSDNFLEIDQDSFIYLKQLLKTYNEVDGNIVRPFIVFAYLETKLGFLTQDEFKYLVPLCINAETTKMIENEIRLQRTGKGNTDNVLINVMMAKENYSQAYTYFMENSATEDLICSVGMNRKSRVYDKAYYPFYNELKSVVLDMNDDLLPLYEATKKISGKSKTFWSNLIFKNFNRGGIKTNGRKHLTNVAILEATNEKEFKDAFFKMMHLFKMKSTLSDYLDLNRRYFKTTETVIFADSKVEFDIMPKCYFGNIADELLSIAFTESKYLFTDVGISTISPIFGLDIYKLYQQLGIKVGKTVTTATEAKAVVRDERYVRFNKLIDEKFSNDALVDLLNKFDVRDDAYLRSYITDNANVPTMFEYILGIAWYKISDRQGDILDYMNLSLEADLLPKTHAGGGEADIVYLYDETSNYPQHTLLIEATLAENTGQRVLEMESVSRHIGEYCLKNKDKEAYCIFISTKLLLNLIRDFRTRKTTPYFSSNGENFVEGTKIIPLKTTELKTILQKDIKYTELYPLFEQAYQSTIGVKDWYNNEILNKI
ncbi:hypothetical protein AN641_04315 [Candidatus Epulonipiscioides gigas]|nr:hypothetical protein AN641_04315 [Epulopiscium sp. SCG-C07WGA-EpuloA2]